jgi:hypothetical protein
MVGFTVNPVRFGNFKTLLTYFIFFKYNNLNSSETAKNLITLTLFCTCGSIPYTSLKGQCCENFDFRFFMIHLPLGP